VTLVAQATVAPCGGGVQCPHSATNLHGPAGRHTMLSLLLCRQRRRLWGRHGRPGLLQRHGQLSPGKCSTICCACWSCSCSGARLLLYILLLHQTLLSMTSSDTGPSSSFSREPCRVTARRLPLIPDANTPAHQHTHTASPSMTAFHLTWYPISTLFPPDYTTQMVQHTMDVKTGLNTASPTV